jgi:hypothetical protein
MGSTNVWPKSEICLVLMLVLLIVLYQTCKGGFMSTQASLKSIS